jgi:hypothetical protein
MKRIKEITPVWFDWKVFVCNESGIKVIIADNYLTQFEEPKNFGPILNYAKMFNKSKISLSSYICD